MSETEDDLRNDLTGQSGALAYMGDRAVAGLRFERRGDHLHVRRVAVDPAYQRRGIGRALMDWVQRQAASEGFQEVRVGVRSELPGNQAFYEKLGYQVIAGHSHPGRTDITWYEMRLSLLA